METDHQTTEYTLTIDHTFSSALYTLGPINLQTHVSGMYLQTLPSQHPESRLNLGLWHCLYLGSGMEVFPQLAGLLAKGNTHHSNDECEQVGRR